GPPRFLAIDADVQLGDVALVAGIGLGHAAHPLHRIEHAPGGELESRYFGPLHVDLNRRAAAAKDRRLASAHRRLYGGDTAELSAEVVLKLEHRSPALFARLQLHKNAAVVRRSAEAASDV